MNFRNAIQDLCLAQGHWVLASGRHSEWFVVKDRLFSDVRLMSQACHEIAERADLHLETIDYVVGLEKAGIVFGILVASELMRLKENLSFAIAEKDGDDFQFNRELFLPIKGRKVLVVEDILTTGGSVQKALRLIRRHGGDPVGVGALVNRDPDNVSAESIGVEYFNALVDLKLPSDIAGTCPLCAQGLPADEQYGHGRKFNTDQRIAQTKRRM